MNIIQLFKKPRPKEKVRVSILKERVDPESLLNDIEKLGIEIDPAVLAWTKAQVNLAQAIRENLDTD